MENVSPEAAYLTKGNIVAQIDTVSDALPAAALTQHQTKATAEVAAQEVRGRTRLDEGTLNTVTHSGGSIRRGR
jgi:hypothetical protein